MHGVEWPMSFPHPVMIQRVNGRVLAPGQVIHVTPLSNVGAVIYERLTWIWPLRSHVAQK